MWRCFLLATCSFMFLLGPANGCCGGKTKGGGGGGGGGRDKASSNKTRMISEILGVRGTDPPDNVIQELTGLSNNFNSYLKVENINITVYLQLKLTTNKTEAIRDVTVNATAPNTRDKSCFFAKTGELAKRNQKLWCIRGKAGVAGEPIGDIILVRLTDEADRGKNPKDNKYKSQLSGFSKCIELLKEEYTETDEVWICWSVAPA